MKKISMLFLLELILSGALCAADDTSSKLSTVDDLAGKIHFAYHFDAIEGTVTATLTAKDTISVPITSDALSRGGPMHAYVQVHHKGMQVKTSNDYFWKGVERRRREMEKNDAMRLPKATSLQYKDKIWDYIPGPWAAAVQAFNERKGVMQNDMYLEFVLIPMLYFRASTESSVHYSGIKVEPKSESELKASPYTIKIDTKTFRALLRKQEENARNDGKTWSDALPAVQLREPITGISESTKQRLAQTLPENSDICFIGCSLGISDEGWKNVPNEYPDNFLEIIEEARKLVEAEADVP